MSFQSSLNSVQTMMINAQTLPTLINNKLMHKLTFITTNSSQIYNINPRKTVAEVNVNFALKPISNACLAAATASVTSGHRIIKKSATTGIGESVVMETISHRTILRTKLPTKISTMINSLISSLVVVIWCTFLSAPQILRTNFRTTKAISNNAIARVGQGRIKVITEIETIKNHRQLSSAITTSSTMIMPSE